MNCIRDTSINETGKRWYIWGSDQLREYIGQNSMA